MRLLLDQDVFALTAQFLSAQLTWFLRYLLRVPYPAAGCAETRNLREAEGGILRCRRSHLRMRPPLARAFESRVSNLLLNSALSRLGHDVVTAGRMGLAQAGDEEILHVAHEDERILVTRDRDFGNLVFVRALDAGVLYLRIRPSAQVAVHAQLETVLNSYAEEELRGASVVIEASGHRIRRLTEK